MKALVPIKRVPDYATKVRIKGDGSGIETDGIKWIVNPFDEIAVEEALRLKEKGVVSEVVVCSIGPEEITTQLRYAMAMGADSAILVKNDSNTDSDIAARTIAALFKKYTFSLVILGKQAIDSDAGQTPQILATILDIPHASFASKISIENGLATVVREIDGGLETMKIPIPCVISTDLRLNEPRYASLPGIQKAKKKPLDVISMSDIGVRAEPKVVIKKMYYPQQKSAGKKVSTVQELISALQNEAKVI